MAYASHLFLGTVRNMTPSVLSGNTPTPTAVDVESFLGAGGSAGLLFSAPWCTAGQMLVEQLLHLSTVGRPLVVVDCDEFVHVADRFQVKSLPTFLVVDATVEKCRLSGAFSAEQVKDWLAKSPKFPGKARS